MKCNSGESPKLVEEAKALVIFTAIFSGPSDS